MKKHFSYAASTVSLVAMATSPSGCADGMMGNVASNAGNGAVVSGGAAGSAGTGQNTAGMVNTAVGGAAGMGMAGTGVGGAAGSNTGTAGMGVAGMGVAGMGTAGMGTAGTGMAGMTGGGTAGGGTGEPVIPPTWETMRQIFNEVPCNASDCHGGNEFNPLNLVDDADLYMRLTTTTSEKCENLPIVDPGNPGGSAIVRVLNGPCGELNRMPDGCFQNEFENNCVPDEYIIAVEQWILAGAPMP